MTATAVPRPLRIDYESEEFPADGLVTNGAFSLQTTWDELLWAALTIGRPNISYVFRHGESSLYEAIFRLSLMRMALEQRGPSAYRLCRTAAAISLDPTEKGAVSYFLGMTMCKLFCEQLLEVPWMMHLDVFRPDLDVVLRSRSRPDLVGQTLSGDWVALESKGRISIPSAEAKKKAKQQAEQIVSIDGISPSFHVGGIAYFRNDVLNFFWRDPKPTGDTRGRAIKLEVSEDDWQHCYLPALALVQSKAQIYKQMLDMPILLPVRELDLEIGIHPEVLRFVGEGQWAAARSACRHLHREQRLGDYCTDGIRVVAGSSWREPFKEFFKQE